MRSFARSSRRSNSGSWLTAASSESVLAFERCILPSIVNHRLGIRLAFLELVDDVGGDALGLGFELFRARLLSRGRPPP
jgi:hypothetical protein